MKYTEEQIAFLKCMDFMRLGQAIDHKQWQSASMIVRRLDDMAREAGINDFERAFTGIRQSINRKDMTEAKQILSIVVNKRAKYLNDLGNRE
jgi:hypothetical protein